jgi:cytochrome c biogenesis protein CcmG, thiol:disulfide interchange protein DsbE
MRRSLVLSITAALVLLACAPRATSGGGGTDASPAASLLPKNRLDLPSFDLPKYQALLEELRGAPVVVNIWGSWCPPCRVEAPGLARLAREFEGDVQFVGVDILDVRESARQFILEFDWPYPSVFDEDAEIRDRLGYVGQPVTIVYDRDGTVTFEWVGAITEGLLRREIRKVI